MPALRDFNELLGLDEARFMRETQGTFKLGIEFRGWDRAGHGYFHPFGSFGELWGGVEFQHFWLRARRQGLDPPPLEEFSVAVRACRRNAFDFPSASTFSRRSTVTPITSTPACTPISCVAGRWATASRASKDRWWTSR